MVAVTVAVSDEPPETMVMEDGLMLIEAVVKVNVAALDVGDTA